ncbi:autoinducer binding domain-containing protein [Halomonas sp. KO116]|uniref:autoinducer binding domain-containing protein n=1 Tax=Halomonas sp. KO116 TaxID=1504981 RepID=UPI0004E46AA1|nr:autoinducer binding domain-containing protein [Halomonas sp. KO116]AJY50076.1 transcriptional regulator, LuxR family [Halomonas sp. KO116]
MKNHEKIISKKQEEFLNEVQANLKKNDHDFSNVLSLALEKLGIHFFSYVHLDTHPEIINESMIIGNYPKEWVEIYINKKLIKKDPVIKNTSVTTAPFFWNEAKNIAGNEIFNTSQKFGIHQGFTIPIHEPGNAFGSMHFASDNKNTSFKSLINDNINLLIAISFMANLNRPSKIQNKKIYHLTDREKECLFWVTKGKTYSEISIILGITERTIKFHTKNIIEKFDSVNIKQAITIALRLNLL